ncbi:type III restriction protein res subunit [Entomoplasma ellychniae]|uniref:Type III restriction protein res subunit n=1 Tax=Entomoplasma ellychniae TaxID=2114 RepID=A0A8E2QZ37_9MOLU|nr:DEAD/DEAH box helicase family protein [Entomoplasma ellychniae]PPE05089.1 type III restriction protein res subunit [Entomoplasma ellychniae]
MNPEIEKLQLFAINKIEQTLDVKNIVTFKSPTGSGKTIMLCKLINSMISKNSELIFLVSSLSKSELALQNHETFFNFSVDNPLIKPFYINSETSEEASLQIPCEYNVYSLPTNLYNKHGKLFKGILESFLNNIKLKGKKIILIRDECHIETTNLSKLNHFFDKILNISATPQTTKFLIDVEISEYDAERFGLIKQVKEMGNGGIEEFELAIKHFISVKEKYIKTFNINPCMIVQISNEDKGSYEWKTIKKILNNPQFNLHWMYLATNIKDYDTNDKIKNISNSNKKIKWKKYARNNNSQIDVIISKMVITEGWDIPRACMLFQLRDTKSKSLTEQIVGRVRRNPILKNWNDYVDNKNDYFFALQSWVWGDLSKVNRNFKRVYLKKDLIKVQTTSLQKIIQVHSDHQFDIRNFAIQNQPLILEQNIFKLYKLWQKMDYDLNKQAWNVIKNFNDWKLLSNSTDRIIQENRRILKDYEKTMFVNKISGLQQESYFEITKQKLTIKDSLWRVIDNYFDDNDDSEICFDSEAEKKFAIILSLTKNTVWARNFYPNSTINFEYINITKTKSYPDFILKDKNNLNHIFEVKSFNLSNEQKIDILAYKEKISDLAECYLFASKKTNQTFYIPILIGNLWEIRKFSKGVEHIIDDKKLIEELSV